MGPPPDFRQYIGGSSHSYIYVRKLLGMGINLDYMSEKVQYLELIAQLIPVPGVFPDYKCRKCRCHAFS